MAEGGGEGFGAHAVVVGVDGNDGGAGGVEHTEEDEVSGCGDKADIAGVEDGLDEEGEELLRAGGEDDLGEWEVVEVIGVLFELGEVVAVDAADWFGALGGTVLEQFAAGFGVSKE